MPNVWKPTRAQLAEIRRHAAQTYKERAPVLEVGIRYNVDDDRQSTNILLVTESEDWDDTDLLHHYPLATLQEDGVPLTEDGRALLDFYVYERESSDRGDLLGNVQAYYGEGRLERYTDI